LTAATSARGAERAEAHIKAGIGVIEIHALQFIDRVGQNLKQRMLLSCRNGRLESMLKC
jgi:hypothetical protein